jgi:hypothetical protein
MKRCTGGCARAGLKVKSECSIVKCGLDCPGQCGKFPI